MGCILDDFDRPFPQSSKRTRRRIEIQQTANNAYRWRIYDCNPDNDLDCKLRGSGTACCIDEVERILAGEVIR